MHMEIASFVVTIGVSTYKSLMPRKILTAKLLPHLMDFLQCEIVVIPVPWVKTDNANQELK